MPDFASMLKYLREREHLSQRELAAKLGKSASTIGMYESGKRHPNYEDEELIADFFNVDLNTLRGKRTNENNEREKAIQAILKNFPDEILNDADTATLLMEFATVVLKIKPEARVRLLQTLKSLIS